MKKKVIIRAPMLSLSGYGKHARFILSALRQYSHLFEIYILNINWGKTGYIWEDTEERQYIDKKIEETMHYVNNGGQFDMSIQCTIPGEFEKIAPFNVGVTAGTESTKISPEWMQKCNQNIDRIITVSNHASYSFQNTRYVGQTQAGENVEVKINAPVNHVNFPVDKNLCQNLHPTNDEFRFDTDFNFLVIAQWSPRKNLEKTIRWWLDEYKDNENVGLIVKTSIANGSRVDREYTEQRLKDLLSQYKEKKCKVYMLHGSLDDETLRSLYGNETVKCLLSLGNEGFNLPAFESVYNNIPVVALNWSGHLDFLYKNENGEQKCLFSPVDYDLGMVGEVQPEAVWDTVIQKDSYWAVPKESSYKQRIKEVYENWSQFKEKAIELGQWVQEEFSEEKQYEKFVRALGFENLEEKQEQILEFD